MKTKHRKTISSFSISTSTIKPKKSKLYSSAIPILKTNQTIQSYVDAKLNLLNSTPSTSSLKSLKSTHFKHYINKSGSTTGFSSPIEEGYTDEVEKLKEENLRLKKDLSNAKKRICQLEHILLGDKEPKYSCPTPTPYIKPGERVYPNQLTIQTISITDTSFLDK